MHRIGINKTVWVFFALAFIIIATVGIIAIKSGRTIQALFIIGGALISAIQGAVSYNNMTGRENIITRYIRGFFSRFRRIIKSGFHLIA